MKNWSKSSRQTISDRKFIIIWHSEPLPYYSNVSFGSKINKFAGQNCRKMKVSFAAKLTPKVQRMKSLPNLEKVKERDKGQSCIIQQIVVFWWLEPFVVRDNRIPSIQLTLFFHQPQFQYFWRDATVCNCVCQAASECTIIKILCKRDFSIRQTGSTWLYIDRRHSLESEESPKKSEKHFTYQQQYAFAV